jgi:hypothetical protein
MMRDSDNLPSDESLDETIRAAFSLRTDEARLARLERFWHLQSQRQAWRRKLLVTLPLMAAAAAVFVSAFLWSRHEERQEAQGNRNTLPRADNTELANNGNSERTSIDPPGRPPTAYEQFVFAARTSAHTPATTMSAVIDEAINQARQNPALSAEQIVQSPGFERPVAEALLLRRLSRSGDEDQRAILRLLAVCGTTRSTPAILRLGRREALRDEVLRTIESIVGIENLAQLVGSGLDHRMRAAIIRRLLTADSEPALIGYLSLLRDDVQREEALAVAADMSELPIARFVGLLDFKEESVRVSAAMLLGQISDAEVTQLLIDRVTSQPANSREAWMALMVCDGELASNFLAYATQSPQLLGHFNTARVRWSQLVP